MSINSNTQGRAYEYAWITALFNALNPIRKVQIVRNSSFAANERAWNIVSEEKRALFTASANAAVAAVLKFEPRMEENNGDVLCLVAQKDEAGKAGDVRDIVIRRDAIKWEVGLSIKHNHSAVKHSRLAKNLDFGKRWYGVPCSQLYWKDVDPIFKSFETRRGTRWSELNDKENNAYIPLLQAFLAEVDRSCKNNSSAVARMFEYLVGVKDYYKIISNDKNNLTVIQKFNFHGTLSPLSGINGASSNVGAVEIPSKILDMRFKPGFKTIVEIYMDNGWAFSFRLHNASTMVEPSLKFDVQFIDVPASVLRFEYKW